MELMPFMTVTNLTSLAISEVVSKWPQNVEYYLKRDVVIRSVRQLYRARDLLLCLNCRIQRRKNRQRSKISRATKPNSLVIKKSCWGICDQPHRHRPQNSAPENKWHVQKTFN
jgi:hypothetical protein